VGSGTEEIASGNLRVAIVDEHDVVRAGLEAWFAGQHPALTVAGSFPTAADYLTWLRDPPGLAGHPPADVVVIEIQQNGCAPDLDGLAQLCAAGPAVLVYSRLTADEVLLSSIDAGAHSYVAKADGAEHLVAALRCISDGPGPYIGPQMAGVLERRRTAGRLNLSERERQVLTAWLRTDSKDEVGRLLHITLATVRTHLQRVRMKYAAVGRPAHSKAALLARAVEDGIIGLSEFSGMPYGPAADPPFPPNVSQ
jgi:DNA-binding NarL/FixJ family response regulator